MTAFCVTGREVATGFVGPGAGFFRMDCGTVSGAAADFPGKAGDAAGGAGFFRAGGGVFATDAGVFVTGIGLRPAGGDFFGLGTGFLADGADAFAGVVGCTRGALFAPFGTDVAGAGARFPALAGAFWVRGAPVDFFAGAAVVSAVDDFLAFAVFGDDFDDAGGLAVMRVVRSRVPTGLGSP